MFANGCQHLAGETPQVVHRRRVEQSREADAQVEVPCHDRQLRYGTAGAWNDAAGGQACDASEEGAPRRANGAIDTRYHLPVSWCPATKNKQTSYCPGRDHFATHFRDAGEWSWLTCLSSIGTWSTATRSTASRSTATGTPGRHSFTRSRPNIFHASPGFSGTCGR